MHQQCSSANMWDVQNASTGVTGAVESFLKSVDSDSKSSAEGEATDCMRGKGDSFAFVPIAGDGRGHLAAASARVRLQKPSFAVPSMLKHGRVLWCCLFCGKKDPRCLALHAGAQERRCWFCVNTGKRWSYYHTAPYHTKLNPFKSNQSWFYLVV